MTAKVLIVEDDRPIREMLGYALNKGDYQFLEAADTQEAKRLLRAHVPDLILLDWMLPGVSGFDFARELRETEDTRQLPIIMLTARGQEAEKVDALEAGVDDYVTKPFSSRELLARIAAVIRRSRDPEKGPVILLHGLSIDVKAHRVSIHGEPVSMSPIEFKLLHFFAAHPNRVYTRAQILDQVWGVQVYVEERTVDVHIRRLRKVLAPYNFAEYIQTVWSVGYRFSMD